MELISEVDQIRGAATGKWRKFMIRCLRKQSVKRSESCPPVTLFVSMAILLYISTHSCVSLSIQWSHCPWQARGPANELESLLIRQASNRMSSATRKVRRRQHQRRKRRGLVLVFHTEINRLTSHRWLWLQFHRSRDLILLERRHGVMSSRVNQVVKMLFCRDGEQGGSTRSEGQHHGERGGALCRTLSSHRHPPVHLCALQATLGATSAGDSTSCAQQLQHSQFRRGAWARSSCSGHVLQRCQGAGDSPPLKRFAKRWPSSRRRSISVLENSSFEAGSWAIAAS